MEVAITGSTGLIGTALRESLTASGHRPISLARPSSKGLSSADTISWDPSGGTVDAASLEGVDAVVHLAGKGIGDARWTEQHKDEVRKSRTVGTGLLATTLASLNRPPSAFISGSAVGFYGDRGDQILTEGDPRGAGFLADICEAWEDASAPASEAGIRTVNIRTGIVLSDDGGALGKVLPLFRLGLGGRIGHGRQYWPWIGMADHVAAVQHLAFTSTLSGPVNLTAPNPVTNAEFTKALGQALGRPTLLPVPAFGPALLLGREGAKEMLMASQRVVPDRLTDDGFAFQASTIAEGFERAIS